MANFWTKCYQSFIYLLCFEIDVEKKQTIIVHDKRIVLFFIQMPVDFVITRFHGSVASSRVIRH